MQRTRTPLSGHRHRNWALVLHKTCINSVLCGRTERFCNWLFLYNGYTVHLKKVNRCESSPRSTTCPSNQLRFMSQVESMFKKCFNFSYINSYAVCLSSCFSSWFRYHIIVSRISSNKLKILLVVNSPGLGGLFVCLYSSTAEKALFPRFEMKRMQC